MSAGAVRVPELGRLGEPLQGEHILFVDEGELTSVVSVERRGEIVILKLKLPVNACNAQARNLDA